MKRISKIFLVAIFFTLTLVLFSCQSKPNASGTLSVIETTRTSVEIEARITDKATSEDSQIATSSVQVRVYLKSDGTQAGSAAAFNDSSDESLGENEAKDVVTITGLKPDTMYYAELVCTVKSELLTLSTIDFKTTLTGDSLDNPIEIKTADDFNKIKNDLTAYYVLANDIDFADANGDKKEHKPLFSNSSSSKFTGVFDGQGHTIKNFKQSDSQSFYGFFGYLSEGATIKNVNFDGVNIDSTRYSDTTGGIVAGTVSRNARIENVHVTNSTIKISTSTSQTSRMKIGGLVGLNEGGSIVNCSVSTTTIDITAAQYLYIGGLIGENSNTSATEAGLEVADSFASTEIKVRLRNESTSFSEKKEILIIVGGFVGNNLLDGYITNSYSEGTINASFQMELDKQYDKKEETSSQNDEDKKHFDEVIDTRYNVEIGGFVGMNSGFINKVATSTSIDFTSFDAYVVDLGLIAGVITPSGRLQNAVAIGAKQQFRLVLSKEDIKENEDLTNTSSENVTIQDQPNPDEITRKFNLGVVGRNESSNATTTYAVAPSEVRMSILINNYNFKGTSDSYDEFGLSESLLDKINSWLKA